MISCNGGYTVVGTDTVCSAGVFTNSQSCAGNSCPLFVPQNGDLSTCPSVLLNGDSCSMNCRSGYVILGGAFTGCTAGLTTPLQSCGAQPCNLTNLVPPHGSVGSCSTLLDSGGSCSMTCERGYALNASQTSCSLGVATSQTCLPTTDDFTVFSVDEPCAHGRSPCEYGQCQSKSLASSAGITSWSIQCTCASTPLVTFFGPKCSFGVVQCTGCTSTFLGGQQFALLGFGLSAIQAVSIAANASVAKSS